MEGMPMGVEDGLYKLDHELTALDGVHSVRIRQIVEREVRVEVSLDPFDWDVRDRLIELVDNFARNHVAEVSIVLEVLDATDVRASATA